MSEDLRMLQDALDAMEAGENEKARELLSKVVEQEEENVEAWIALSKVVDNEDERRICLTTVLQLDPGNDYAKKELAKSEAKVEKSKGEEEIRPGITRGMVRKAFIASALYIFVVLTVTLLITSAVTAGKNNERIELTRIARDATATVGALETGQAEMAITQTMQSITATAQALALITPTATETQTPDPAFATWTPTATEAAIAFRVLESPPPSIPGVIVGWGGRDATNSGYVDPIRVPVNAVEELTEIINELTRNLTVNVPGDRIVFERFNRRIGEATIVTIDPADPENTLQGLNQFWTDFDIINTEQPSLSADGLRLVFVATARNSTIREVYMIDFSANQMSQITNDGASYSFPEISQDGTQVLAVREDEANGTDLVLINIESFNQIAMTNDGNTLIESQPSWHTDGLQAVYKAHPQGQANNSEIYLLRVLAEAGSSILLIATDADETNPVFDPNGQFVAFASNRAADVYNIYIFDIASLTTYQLTEAEFDYFPGGWSLS